MGMLCGQGLSRLVRQCAGVYARLSPYVAGFAFIFEITQPKAIVRQRSYPPHSIRAQYNYVNAEFAQNYALLPWATIGSGASCGRCVSVKCSDASCSSRPAVVALVVGQCYSCNGDSGIQISSPAFQSVTGSSSGSKAVSWEFVECGSRMSGGIVMTPQDANNLWWQALVFANAAKQIVGVSLNGVALVQQSWGPWVWNNQVRGRP